MYQTNDDLASVYFVLALALDPDLHVARGYRLRWSRSAPHAHRR